MANKKAKEKRRGPGRPKTVPLSPEVLRQKAFEGMRKSAEARGEINYQETEEALLTMLDPKELKKQTKAELNELRKMAEMLWDKFQIEKEVSEAGDSYGVARELTPQEQAAQDEWDKNHEFLKPKRKNAKKTHNIYSLPEHKREAYGLSSEPVKTTIDLDETEQQFNDRVMEEGIKEMEVTKQAMRGKRVGRRDTPKPQSQTQQRSFWV